MPTKQDVGAAGLGAALGIIATWLISFGVDVPGEIGAAIGTVTTWLTVRFFG
jgi:hypothetical protein